MSGEGDQIKSHVAAYSAPEEMSGPWSLGEWLYAMVQCVIFTYVLIIVLSFTLASLKVELFWMFAGIPACFLLAAFNAHRAVVGRRKRRRRVIERRHRQAVGSGVCPKCRYSLRGLENPRCPECGTPFDPADLPPGFRANHD